MLSMKPVLTLAIVFAVGMAAKAQNFEGPDMTLAFGINSANGSTKTVTDSSTGYTASFGMCFQPRRYDIIFRPKLSFTQFSSGDRATTQNLSSMALMADMIWYPNGKQPGFYMFAGGGPTYWSVTARNPDGTDGASKKNIRLGVETGIGYEFDNTIGVEVSYATSEVDHNFRNNTANFSVVFKF
jgi:hypothetical protein